MNALNAVPPPAPTTTPPRPPHQKLPGHQVAVVVSARRMIFPIDRCLASFQTVLADPRDLVLVDNGSGGEMTAWARREFPSITVITRPTDGHFCGGYNSGLEHALANHYDFALIVNADTVVHNPDFIADLVAAASRHPRGAFFGPLVFFREPGVVQDTVLTYPTLLRTFVNWCVSKFRPNWYLSEFRPERHGTTERKVDYLNGVCVLCRLSALREIGLLDEIIGAYSEDTDWNWRARKKNWYSVYVPVPSIIHLQEEQGYEPYSEKMFMTKRNQVYWLLKANRRLEARLFALLVVLQARLRQSRSRTSLEKQRHQYFVDRFTDATRRLFSGEAPAEWFGPPLGKWSLP